MVSQIQAIDGFCSPDLSCRHTDIALTECRQVAHRGELEVDIRYLERFVMGTEIFDNIAGSALDKPVARILSKLYLERTLEVAAVHTDGMG